MTVELKKPRKGILRKSLLAPQGDTLVVADSGQIEARVNAWLAGHTELLRIFIRNDARTAQYQKAFLEAVGKSVLTPAEKKAVDAELAARGIEEGDFYSDFGSMVFGKTITKKTHPNERQQSKSMALGLGFGMGWFKFAMEMAKGMMGASPVIFTEKDAAIIGHDTFQFLQDPKKMERVASMPSRLAMTERATHCAVAEGFVYLYRNRNVPIVDYWETCSVSLKAMDQDIAMEFGPNGVLKTERHAMVLPNGLRMRYPGLALGDDGYSYLGGKSGKERVRAYGGLVCENTVQALARIIVHDQMLVIRAEFEKRYSRFYKDRYFPTATCTHDEVVARAPKGAGEEALAFALETMKTPLWWCPDLPLWASGDVAESYGDAK